MNGWWMNEWMNEWINEWMFSFQEFHVLLGEALLGSLCSHSHFANNISYNFLSNKDKLSVGVKQMTIRKDRAGQTYK